MSPLKYGETACLQFQKGVALIVLDIEPVLCSSRFWLIVVPVSLPSFMGRLEFSVHPLGVFSSPFLFLQNKTSSFVCSFPTVR
jgi:hypothetical protein